MIIKYFELKNKKIDKKNFFLLYGNNKGLVEEVINNILKPALPKNIYNYEETEIINNIDIIKENIHNKSFFEQEKLIIIKRTSDKILKIIEEIINDDIEDITIILVSETLEKKSKLRNFFEKNDKTICVPFYEDNNQTLNSIVQNFLKKNGVKLSQQNINIIVERSRGDRRNLNNELIKIENLIKTRKMININEILKITNLSENYHVSELVDNSLAKNKIKTLNIINENIFSSEDCVMILRVFLTKLKRLLKIKSEQLKNDNIEKIISTIKPPIFWKEKEIVKQQAKIWNLSNIQDLMIKTNRIELLVKKNPSSSIFLVTDFLLENAL